MPDGRFDGPTPFDHPLEGSGKPAPLAGLQVLDARDFNALIAFVDDCDLGLAVGQDTHLLQRFSQGIVEN